MVNRFTAVANIGAAAMAAFILHGCGKEKEEAPELTEEEINKANGDDTAIVHGEKKHKGHTRAEEGGDKKKGKKDLRAVDLENDEDREGSKGFPCETDEDCRKGGPTHYCDKSTEGTAEGPQCMVKHTASKKTAEEIRAESAQRLKEKEGKENWKEGNLNKAELDAIKAKDSAKLQPSSGVDDFNKNTKGVVGTLGGAVPKTSTK